MFRNFIHFMLRKKKVLVFTNQGLGFHLYNSYNFMGTILQIQEMTNDINISL